MRAHLERGIEVIDVPVSFKKDLDSVTVGWPWIRIQLAHERGGASK